MNETKTYSDYLEVEVQKERMTPQEARSILIQKELLKDSCVPSVYIEPDNHAFDPID